MAQISQATELLEDWQMNDAANTPMLTLVNSTSSATFAASADNAFTNGSGNLVFSRGSTTNDNLFRSSNLTTADSTC